MGVLAPWDTRRDVAQGEPGTADFFGLGEPGDALAQMFGDVQRLFSFGPGSLFERHMAEHMQRLFEPRPSIWRCDVPWRLLPAVCSRSLSWLGNKMCEHNAMRLPVTCYALSSAIARGYPAEQLIAY